MQFHVALAMAKAAACARAGAPGGKEPAPAPGDVERGAMPLLATQLEVSAKGIVINSSVIGLIVLSLSLVFFYLYLVYVYPILNVF